MKARIPPGTRAGRLAFAREWMRQARETPTRVRFPRRRRRILVAALFLLIAAAQVALPAASLATSAPREEEIGLVLLAVLLTFMYLFVIGSVGRFVARGVPLDERERAQRDRATAVAYRVIEVAIVVGTFYAIVAGTGKLGLPVPSNAGQLPMFLIPGYFFVLSLPAAVLAWTLPDPDPEPDPG